MTLRRLSCGNCFAGLLAILVMGAYAPACAEYILDSVNIAVPIKSWFPTDIENDGRWELCITLEGNLTGAGVFDVHSRSWRSGPFELPVTSVSWGTADTDNNNVPEFYYLGGDTVKKFDPTTGTIVAMWTSPFTPFALRIYGRTEQSSQVVALSRSYSEYSDRTSYGIPQSDGSEYCFTHLLSLQSGQFIDSFPGCATKWSLSWGYLSANEEAFVLYQHRYSYSGSLMGRYDYFLDSLHVFTPEWSQLRNLRYRLYSAHVSGPPKNEYLAHLATSPTFGQSPGYLVFEMADTYEPDGFAQIVCARANSDGIQWNRSVPTPYRSPHMDFAIFDLDDDGASECYMPRNGSNTWDVRELDSGLVITTLQGMPQVDLRTGPLLDSGAQNLFYFVGSTLYFYRPALPMGIFDGPEPTWDSPGESSVTAQPNPFNSAVTLSWNAASSSSSLTIHNILGQTVRTFDESTLSGSSTITWDGLDSRGRPMASGVYFARLATGDQVATAKLVLLR